MRPNVAQASLPLASSRNGFAETWANLSSCRTYRYALGRRVSDASGRVLFCMLNPSVADEVQGDPTITRCIGFARRWGIGELVACNLYAFRATRPADLWLAKDPIGPLNDDAIQMWAASSSLIVCAWGNQRKATARAQQVVTQLRRVGQIHHLGLTNNGSPRHPLYLRADTEPVLWAA